MGEVNAIINGLPRSGRRFPNAVVWLDASGRLNVEVVGGGALVFSEASSERELWELELGDPDEDGNDNG